VGAVWNGRSGKQAVKNHERFVKEFYKEDSEQRWQPGRFRSIVPRCLPFEFDLSDGLELGASLEYLVDAIGDECGATTLFTSDTYSARAAAMIALTKKGFPGMGGGFLLHARATSGLTNMDYLRFSILCPESTEVVVDRLLADRVLVFPDVWVGVSEEADVEAIADLVKVLAWARIIDLVPRTSGGGGSGSTTTRKRKGSAAT